jgi:multiple sugar transport system substrate-binding protein
VDIISRKNHFELDREMKQDIAAGNINYCVASNHTSFAPQYGDIYRDLREIIPKDVLAGFVQLVLEHSTVNGRLVQLPRHSDVSGMYYMLDLYENEVIKKWFKIKYGYDLMPPDTWKQVSDHAKFFASPPNFFGTQFVGKDEAVTGRFYEMLVAEGGQFLDKNNMPAFNSKAGVRALNWFVDLYNENAVPKGVVNYLWGETGAGFASGTVALNLDWAGWASYFNDPKSSKIAGRVGVIRSPAGSSGKRTGWSGSHTFSITKACDMPDVAASFVTFLTSHENQMVEARKGLLPTRSKVWEDITAESKAAGNDFLVKIFETYGTIMAEDAFTPPLIPEWIEISNVLWPNLQAAILGDKTAKQALDDAAKKGREIMEDAGY